MKKIVLVALLAGALPAFAGIEVTQVGDVRTIRFPSNTMGGASSWYSVDTAPLGNVDTRAPTGSPANRVTPGGFAVDNAGGQMRLRGSGNMPLASNKSVPIDVVAKVPKAAFSKALVLAGKIAWPIGVLMQAGDIYEYLKDAGYEGIGNTPNGVSARKQVERYFEGKEYRVYSGAQPNREWLPTPQEAGLVEMAYLQSVSDPGYSFRFSGCSKDQYSDWTCYYETKASGASNWVWNPAIVVNSRIHSGTAIYFETYVGDELADKIAQESGWPDKAALALSEALKTPGVKVQTDTPEVTGPASVPGEKRTTNEQVKLKPGTTQLADPTDTVTDAGTRTTVKTEAESLTYSGNQVTTNNSTINTTVTITNNVTNEATTDAGPEEIREAEEKSVTCGLPGTPPCKIDEAGTPEAKEDKAKADTDEAMKPFDDFIANPKSALPEFPTINWTFTLPSGCSPIALPAFDPWLQEIDVCQFQPIFHDIMTFVWVMGGIFGAIGIFWRNTFSQG